MNSKEFATKSQIVYTAIYKYTARHTDTHTYKKSCINDNNTARTHSQANQKQKRN